jgi:LPS-assembly protein
VAKPIASQKPKSQQGSRTAPLRNNAAYFRSRHSVLTGEEAGTPRLARANCRDFAPRVIRRLLILAALAVALRGADSPQFVFDAEVTEFTADEAHAHGHVVYSDRGVLILADEAVGNNRTGVATLSGHVELTRGAVRVLADTLVYHRSDGSFVATNVRLGSFPYYAEGATATGTPDEITVLDAKVTYGEPSPWQPTLSAESVSYAPGRQFRSTHSLLGIGPARAVPIPRFRQDLRASLLPFARFNGGYRASVGAFVEAGMHVPTSSGIRLGGDLGVYSARGVMFGPSGTYGTTDNSLTGSFQSGYINDHGDKQTDILKRAIPEDRAFLEWQHQQTLAEGLSLSAQLKWWKDSEVVRDFRPRTFFPVQEPDTFLEATQTGTNFLLSAFGRFQANSFQRVQERLPEIRFDLLPLALGGGFYEQFSAGYVRLRETGPWAYDIVAAPGTVQHRVQPNGTLLQADRLDAYYALSRPLAPTPWFAFTPLAGGRFTHHANAKIDPLFAASNGFAPAVPSSQTRTIGEIGFDAVLRSSGTFAYKNERWKIDGLRHLFTPRLSYRYIEADRVNRMPAIDRPVFSTYLQPLGLADMRAVDTIEDSNTLRLAFDNVLQTRDSKDGTRDLATLTLANDFGFKPHQRDLSGVQAELSLMPARWMRFYAYQRYAPRSSTLREFNTGLEVIDGDAWSLRFSNNFLRDQIEDYAVDGRWRLNEAFRLLARLQYDVRKSRFNEQAYGVVQNIGNTWQISYVLSLYSGRTRESHFGFNIQIDTIRF